MEYKLRLNKQIVSEDIRSIHSLLKTNGYQDVLTDNEFSIWIPYENKEWGDRFLLEFKNSKDEGYLYVDSDRTSRNEIINIIESFFEDKIISFDEC
ncbi:hypothetical protein ACFSX9_10815 [Flavobacterium ardleyense]|uniref:Uncharacterized protein n=1 Tax=Flavobacterium ardleyense TaxID=2038737 RepID=A0ABW5Z932_9FLAO